MCAPRPRSTLALAAALVVGAARPAAAQATAGPAAPGPGRDVAARVDSIANAPVARGEAAGLAVFVVRGRDTLVARGYGRADVENDAPMTAGHVFQLASITKQFTAAAVLALVQDGRVALDSPITRYVATAPARALLRGRRPTVRQLLSHTAGVPDYTEAPRGDALKRLDLPSDSLLALARDLPPSFEPGEQMRYSNTGFALLGQLVERVSGRPYAAFVRERVLVPAGVGGAHFCDPRALVPRLARGYEATRGGLRPAEFISPYMPWAAGGFCATAGDLAAWNAAVHAVRGGRVLAPALYAEMVRPASVGRGPGTRSRVAGRYGLGVMLSEVAGRRAVSHSGDIDGFTTFTGYLPDDSLSVTVLVNTQGPARPDALAAAVVTAVLGPAPAGRALAPVAVALDALAGRYGGELDVAPAADDTGPALRVRGGPLPPVLLRYDGDAGAGPVFTDGRARLTFELRSGRPVAVWGDLGVYLVRWERGR